MIKPGNTPLVELETFKLGNVHIYAKVEGCNPGGSIKDRVGFWLVKKYIDSCVKSNTSSKTKTIIEASSGNTGIGVSIACSIYELKCLICVPKSTSQEKISIMKSFGATIYQVDGTTDDCIKWCEFTAKLNPDNIVWLNQFDNQECVECHYKTTAIELYNDSIQYTHDTFGKGVWKERDDRNIIVCSMGTTGTIMGLSKRFKPLGWAIVGVMPQPNVRIEGLKNLQVQRVPKICDIKEIDQIIQISDVDALITMRELARSEGIMAGPSSGAALYVASIIAKQYSAEKRRTNIIVILPDRGQNYLSQGVWDEKGVMPK